MKEVLIMDPVAFRLFGTPIMWYGVLITIGVLVAFVVVYFNAKRSAGKVSFDDVTDAFLYAFPLALIGARVYYVIFELDQYDTFMEMLDFRSGGLAIHGGLIGAAIGVFIYKLIKKKNMAQTLDMADAAAPAIILAQAIGRWGNFMNQEAHGGPVTEAFISKFPEFIQNGMLINGTYYHPTFLYESIWNVLVFIVLMIWFGKKKEKEHGIILYAYMILYSIGRFYIEGLRTDSLMFFGMRQAQLISLVAIFFGVIMIYITKKRARTA